MEHVPTTESDVEKVYRIARVLDISLEDAALTCAGFELAFSDDGMRRAIFEMIDELDASAAKKGEPLGLIISYTVELGMDGIRVGRYADEIPAGEIVELTPAHRANILLRIVDNFPTQEFLGPLIVNRPELPSLAKEGWQTDAFCRADGVVYSDSDMKEPAILLGPSSLERTGQPIRLGPIRLTFNDRFLFLSAAGSSSLLADSISLSGVSVDSAFARPLLAAAASHRSQSTSGLSPPIRTENWDTPNESCSFGIGSRRRDM